MSVARNLEASSAPKNIFSRRYFGKFRSTSSELGLRGFGLYSISSNSLSCVNLNCKPKWKRNYNYYTVGAPLRNIDENEIYTKSQSTGGTRHRPDV